MDIFEKFLMNELVVNISWYGELILFFDHMKQAGLTRIKDFYRVTDGGKDIDWVLSKWPFGELCIEYQIGKGFTFSGKADNLNYGNEVVDIYTFVKGTKVPTFIDKKYIKAYQELDALPEKFRVTIIYDTLEVSGSGKINSITKSELTDKSLCIPTRKTFISKKALETFLDKRYYYSRNFENKETREHLHIIPVR